MARPRASDSASAAPASRAERRAGASGQGNLEGDVPAPEYSPTRYERRHERVVLVPRRQFTPGELGSRGLNRRGTAFPSPTAHFVPLGAVVTSTMIILTPVYLTRLSEMSIVAVQVGVESVKRIMVELTYDLLQVLGELSQQLQEILRAYGKVVIMSGNLLQGCLILTFLLAVLFYAPLLWKIFDNQTRYMMMGKSYSSDTMKDGPRMPIRATGLPFIRANEVPKTDWTGYIGCTLGFCYDGGTQIGEFREGVLKSVTCHGLHTSIFVVCSEKTRRYYLDRVGDVVIMKQPGQEQLALTDARPDPDFLKDRGPDSAGAVVASGAERVVDMQQGAPWQDALQRIEREEMKRPLAGYSALPKERMLYNDDILPFISGAIANHTYLMRVSLFTMDIVVAPAFASRMVMGGTEVYIILDKSNVNKPSCTRQRRAMLDLREWGVHMRARRPKSGMMSYQHEKTWLFDQNLLIVGSWNCSENSTENCEEACVASKSPVLIASHNEHFDKLWRTAQEIDWEDVERKEEAALEEKLAKQRNRSPSRSKAR